MVTALQSTEYVLLYHATHMSSEARVRLKVKTITSHLLGLQWFLNTLMKCWWFHATYKLHKLSFVHFCDRHMQTQTRAEWQQSNEKPSYSSDIHIKSPYSMRHKQDTDHISTAVNILKRYLAILNRPQLCPIITSLVQLHYWLRKIIRPLSQSNKYQKSHISGIWPIWKLCKNCQI